MSTILKALRRLEEEKAAAEEPRPLREQIATTPRASDRPRRRGWLGAIVALVLSVAAGGGLSWWFFTGSSEPVQLAAATPEPAPVPVARPVPAVQPAPALPTPAPAAGPPEQAYESDVEIIDRPDALPRLADSEPIAPGSGEPKLGSTRPVESSAAMERAREAALAEYAAAERARRGIPPQVVAPAAPTPVEPTVQPPAPEPPAPVAAPPDAAAPALPPEPAREVAVAPEAPAPAPPLEPAPQPAPEMKPAARPPAPKPPVREAAAPPPRPAPPPAREALEPPPAELPPFAIEKTQWHPLADRRVAWLRMPGESEARRVVEGDVVDGLLVAKIEPSGVVFERDGKKIQRVLGQR